MDNCLECGYEKPVKNGRIHNGKQRFLCHRCGRQFVENPENRVISQATKDLIDKLLLERISLAGIAGVTGVSELWLQKYVNAKYESVPQQVQIRSKKKGRLTLQCDVCVACAVQSLLIVNSREPLRIHQHPVMHLEVKKPSSTEQRSLWETALGSLAPELNGHLQELVSQFNLSPSTIQVICSEARRQEEVSKPKTEVDNSSMANQLWNSCLTQARSRLDNLAQCIKPVATWDDLVLPEPQLEILRQMVAQVRQRTKVYETWEFAVRGSNGLGISALFAGVSGTGKTMAAEVIAWELRLDLYRIDLSQVVSKYIGETEKNLKRVFDAAEAGGAILLFDEADALFGKRSEVKDSHDRYANIEVSYLLQRMEAYRGLAIMTTNMKNAINPAFLRRTRFVVQFPFPDFTQRREIWRRMFPSKMPTEGLDLSKLARLNLAGGNIRNIALNAAFLAADAGEPVQMIHLLHAAHSEYAKLEKTLTEAEVRGWI